MTTPTIRMLLVFGAMVGFAAVDASKAAPRGASGVIGDSRLTVTTVAGSGLLPLFLSPDWTKPREEITRVIIIFHGYGRNVASYFNMGKDARKLAGEQGSAMIIAPQFLATEDLEHNHPGDAKQLLRWTTNSWKHGWPALGPAPLSSFDAIDAILDRLADRTMFPNLAEVVVAGHSAGGQIVQRYAVVGTGGPKLAAIGVHVRYVIANPSSNVYFSEDRPDSIGFCPTFNNWGYGMNRRPPYAVKRPPTDFERAYVGREIVYLLGEKDTDPNGEELDKSCPAEAQGKFRLARGRAYFDYMQRCDPGSTHRLVEVPGVGHSAGAMFKSACGVGVLFNRPAASNLKRLSRYAADEHPLRPKALATEPDADTALMQLALDFEQWRDVSSAVNLEGL